MPFPLVQPWSEACMQGWSADSGQFQLGYQAAMDVATFASVAQIDEPASCINLVMLACTRKFQVSHAELILQAEFTRAKMFYNVLRPL